MERECRRRRGDAWPCLKMKDRGQKQINQTCQFFLFFSCKEQEFLSFIFLIRLNYKYLLIHDHTLWFYLQCLKEAGCGTCTGLLKILLPQWQQMAFNTAWAWRQEDTRRATKMPRTQECTSCGLPRRMSLPWLQLLSHFVETELGSQLWASIMTSWNSMVIMQNKNRGKSEIVM